MSQQEEYSQSIGMEPEPDAQDTNSSRSTLGEPLMMRIYSRDGTLTRSEPCVIVLENGIDLGRIPDIHPEVRACDNGRYRMPDGQ